MIPTPGNGKLNWQSPVLLAEYVDVKWSVSPAEMYVSKDLTGYENSSRIQLLWVWLHSKTLIPSMVEHFESCGNYDKTLLHKTIIHNFNTPLEGLSLKFTGLERELCKKITGLSTKGGRVSGWWRVWLIMGNYTRNI